MAEPFSRAVDLILCCGQSNGRVVVTGMGKSRIIAQKIAATLSPTSAVGTASCLFSERVS
jgi:arabinose-5-phosphate isomerase